MPGYGHVRFQKRYHDVNDRSVHDEGKYVGPQISVGDDSFEKRQKKYFNLRNFVCIIFTLGCIFLFVTTFVWINYSNIKKTQTHYVMSNDCIPLGYQVKTAHWGHGVSTFKGYLVSTVLIPYNSSHVVKYCQKDQYNILYGYDNSKTRLENKLQNLANEGKQFTCYIQDNTCQGVVTIDNGNNTLKFGIVMTSIACCLLILSIVMYIFIKKRHRLDYLRWRLDEIDVYDEDSLDNDDDSDDALTRELGFNSIKLNNIK